ncbi:response regulator transcription factor [Pseudomonas chlororaphis]|uniref:OmpR family response regulator n=1 Tax=Pseudomonas chlororaphis TaxID=587753 RepID=A0AAX3FUN1_9PSED|nr:response regulator transcription factor [Pseudomonas chlororaphis]AZC39854.1 DNA-binding response regulator [Pseudomonas chlororaphis subsp. piscium]AZC46411.1 DNA-binding response regulator [Pseudomonas chlororaphis subsp. piscium]AZC59401.1 DNA-binding response regulator [Pseudomonas chlororaphis subsp. piscium]WDG71917.1 response regulator transcription factor [Pseudomonas chlororaphis]WDH30299.1 response regulator transcription factor [Pseudomonas chlororaphis]
MRIAILDDEPMELELLQDALDSYSLHDGTSPICTAFSRSPELLRRLKRETFDLIILDWQMPEISGLQMLLWIKEHLQPAPPVIMLTSRTAEHDVVQALNAGADEYISKPFRQAELRARLTNLLRHCQGRRARDEELLIFGNIRFDVQESRASVDAVPVALTLREFKLALLLFKNQGRPLSRGYLYEHLWARDEMLSSRTLDTHVYRIRNKLKLTSEYGWVLSTVYGYGYRLEALGAQETIEPS